MNVKNELTRIGIILLFATLAVLCMIPVFFLINFVSRLLNIQSLFVKISLILFFSLILIYFFVRLIGFLINKYSKNHSHDYHQQFHENHGYPKHKTRFMDTLQAIDKIATGNFDIKVDTAREYGHYYNDLAVKINKMAEELKSMELMRQEFVSSVSHEIQSPLTSISGYASLLKDDDLTREDKLKYVNVIESESKRLSKLSESLLKLSVLDSSSDPLNSSEYRLDKQIESILITTEPQWSQKNVILNLDLKNIIVTADENLIAQVLINLISNSIKFTPAGGEIKITIDDDIDNTYIEISDTGIGISNEDQVHIFERFYKVDKARERSSGGNGLGLAIVKKIVHLHRGQISVQSEVNKGSTFKISLPKS